MAIISLGFNLDDAAAVLPAGVYQLQASDAEAQESGSGNDMVKIKWQVVNDPQFTGRVVFDNLVLVESMARRLKRAGDAMGLDFSMGVDPELIKGRTVWAETSVEAYQGEDQPKVKSYRTGR